MPVLLLHNGAITGQVLITGGCVSTTLILNEHVAPVLVLILTEVLPTGKKDPEAGVAVTVPQLPDMAGNGKLTTAPHCPGTTGATILAGQVILHEVPPEDVAVVVEELFEGLMSILPLVTCAELFRGPARLSAVLTFKVKVAVAPVASIGIVAITCPEVPGCGVETPQPAGAVKETNVEPDCRKSVMLTFSALLGPLFRTVMV
jgi:hypothetical protein